MDLTTEQLQLKETVDRKFALLIKWQSSIGIATGLIASSPVIIFGIESVLKTLLSHWSKPKTKKKYELVVLYFKVTILIS